MASPSLILLALIAAVVFWTAVGALASRLIMPSAIAAPAAAVIGWAIHSALALPLHMLIGLSRLAVLLQVVLTLGVAILALRLSTKAPKPISPIPWWAYAAAFVIALAPAIAVFPKPFADGVALASPIFDHSKVAMIDEIIRSGAMPANPFFGGAGERLSYYFLWHFSAAELAVLTGVSSWEAEAGLAWFTAFASLSLMMGLAVWLSGRTSAAVCILLLAVTASARPVISLVIGAADYDWLLQEASGFGGWLFQASWAPQHLMSASCVIVAMILLACGTSRDWLRVAALGLVAAAAFGSSVWIGGVTFAFAALVACAALVPRMTQPMRTNFAIGLVLAALFAAILSASLLLDQFAAAAQRGGGSPFTLQPFWVLGDSIPLRHWLDVPGYWLLYLVVELPAIYPLAMIAVMLSLRGVMTADAPRAVLVSLLALSATGLLIAAYAASTVGVNNDLAWRGALPAIMVLMVFAAFGLSHWIAAGTRRWLIVAAVGISFGLPEGVRIIRQNAFPEPTESAVSFAQTPEMWEAVRRHAGPFERVGNNPYFQRDLTPWPINISWALMSNRRSCYAGSEFIIPFTPLKPDERASIDAQFKRVFEGKAAPTDVKDLAMRYDCRVIVVAAQDGAWANDPFAASTTYRLVEQSPDRWRIYRVNEIAKPG